MRARATRGPAEEGEREGEERVRVRMGRSGVRVALGGGEEVRLLSMAERWGMTEEGEGKGEEPARLRALAWFRVRGSSCHRASPKLVPVFVSTFPSSEYLARSAP